MDRTSAAVAGVADGVEPAVDHVVPVADRVVPAIAVD
jgi:hypothetical protein